MGTVLEAGRTFELLTEPTPSLVPAAQLCVRAALKFDEQLYENATRSAKQGAALARMAGLEAAGLAVAGTVPVVVVREDRHGPRSQDDSTT